MAQRIIGIGAVADDGTGDPLRTGWSKANDNFTELYGMTNLPQVFGPITGAIELVDAVPVGCMVDGLQFNNKTAFTPVLDVGTAEWTDDILKSWSADPGWSFVNTQSKVLSESVASSLFVSGVFNLAEFDIYVIIKKIV